jgi:MEMO1 family protein
MTPAKLPWTRSLTAIALALLLTLLGSNASEATGESSTEMARKPAVAGSFYPQDSEALRAIVGKSIGSAPTRKFKHPIKAILAPHAGYLYCSQSFGAAYRPLKDAGFPYDTVILIGPSHRFPTKAAAVCSALVWETPLGPVQVDTEMAQKFVELSDRIEFDDRAHVAEHSLEVQLPFLKIVSGDRAFKIVPLVTNSRDPLDHEILAQALSELGSDSRTLIVLSSDLSHYPSAENAEIADKAILEAVKSLDASKLSKENRRIMKQGYPKLSVTMCGLEATAGLLRACRRLGISEAEVVSQTNSGMVSGGKGRVVGYGAVIFSGSGKTAGAGQVKPSRFQLSEKSAGQLVSLARSAVHDAVSGNWVSYDPVENPELQAPVGCFVTIKNKDKLRGCVGRFTADQPLWKTVRDMAISAATRDRRFINDPINEKELPELDIEVSVLSPLQPVTDPLSEIKLGRDGIWIKDKGRSGTFLPQVATETGWSLEEFLGHCARDKAGLGWNGWKSPTARIFTYTATILHEKKP